MPADATAPTPPATPAVPRPGWWRIELNRLEDLRLSNGLMFPALGGLILFGFRVVGVWATVVAGALVARFLLARLRTWTATPGKLSLLIRATTVSLFVPATLFDPDLNLNHPDALWPGLVATGGLLALADWFVRATGTRRLHPVVLTVAVLTLAVPSLTHTHRVLRPNDLVTGDVLDARVVVRNTATAVPWFALPKEPAKAIESTPPEEAVQAFLHGTPPPGRTTQTVARLLSDDLPPLEDLIVGGRPAPLGQGSVILLVIGGLFLVYRGVTPLRVPALALCACYATLAVLPLPVLVGPAAGRMWLFERDPRVGWFTGLTFVHYVLTASPFVVTTLFLAPQPGVRPARKWPAALFAIVYGTAAAAATVFVSVAGGAVLALLVVQAVWPRGNASGPLSRVRTGEG